MKKAGILQLAALVVALCLLPSSAFGIYLGNNSAKSASPGGPEYKKGEVLVKFRSGARARAIERAQRRLGLKTLKRYPRIGVHHLSIEGSGLTVREAIKLLRSSPEVLYAEPNYRRSIALMPNDPRTSQLWGLHNTGQTGGTADADIDAPEAWDITTGSAAIVVGVIDTGVDYTHPDLVANMWHNPGEIPGNFIDDDGNGYVDDVYGIDPANGDSNPFDDAGHGTHVSGTIGGVGNNGVGVVGVNWNVKIMALKFLDASGSGWTNDAIECLNYAVMMKNTYGVNIKLTSNSWGGGGVSQALEDAIAASGNAGMLFMAAAGNNGTDNDSIPQYPSNIDLANIVAVAATDHNDNLASFSCYGATTVDLGAPGVGIRSTTPGNTYSLYDGTSMATPHVSGAAALLWADNPTLTSQEVKEILLSNVDLIPALNGKSVTGGRLNVFNALTCDSSGVRFAISLSDGFTAEQGMPLTLSAYLTECSFLRGATMTVEFTNGDPIVTLVDDGVAPDASANDGVYTGSWTPGALGPVTADFTAEEGGNTYTTSVSSEVVLFSGYYSDDTVPYNWIEISGTGTRLILGDEDQAIVPAPFPISLYGVIHNSITIGSNGDIFFENNYSDYLNLCIPASSFYGVETYLAPFWTDLDLSVGGGVYYEARGTSPNRMLIVEYSNVPHWWTTGTVSFEIIFYEDSDDILMQYKDVTLTGSSYNLGAAATIGVQRDSAYGQQYSCNEASLSNQMAILWYRYVAPTISRNPAALNASCAIGTNASSQTFEVWNSGAESISYTITDDAGWLDCTPSGGSSTGVHDTITVNYTTSALGIGAYSATITITDPGVANSPQTIDVSLAVNPPSHILTTNVSPAGAGSVIGGGSHFEDSVATVQANANVGWEFDRWEGDDIAGSTANPEQITMDTDKSVTAVFVVSRHSLTVNVSPLEAGTATGGGTYDYGRAVPVEAFPNPDWRFDHWSGGGVGGSTANPEQVTVNQDTTVTAVFVSTIIHTLTVEVWPVGSGSAIGGGVYPLYTVVQVQAFPGVEWTFSHWEGAEIDGSTTNPEWVTIDSDATVTAIFFSDSVLSRIDLSFPQNEAVLYSAPVFTWTPDGGTNNRYAVDLTFDGTFSSYWSTLNLGRPISETSWQAPQQLWDVVPPGSYVYWRVRGADMNRVPLSILGSAEVRWFYKY